jgi:hypothetical protein
MQNAPVRSVFRLPISWQPIHAGRNHRYRLPDDLQERAHELLELNGEGELTDEDRDELFDFVRVDEMMSLLRPR